jgi:uncharacterized protein YbjT (DUF2867 family)
MRIVVLGASGQLGREVVGALAARKYAVRAVVRRSPTPTLDSSIDVQIVDAHKQVEICQALSGCDAVVNAIGAGTLRRNNVESTTTAVAVAATEEVGIQRYIAISAGMVALDWFLFKYVLRPLIFRNIYAEHCRVEEIVEATSLAWTIVRPPKLTNGPPIGYVAGLQRDPKLFSAARADVASFIADELRDKKYLRQAVFVASCRKEKENDSR